MSFLDTLRSGIALANNLTSSLQASVVHKVSAGQDLRGKQLYPTAVNRRAIVEMKQKSIKTPSGELVMARASVLFLDPAVIVKVTDQIILPDGSTGPILDIEGFVDAEIGKPMLTQVFLG